MTSVPDPCAYPQAVRDEFARLAVECRACYQCGTCTSSCPSGRELYRGPRRIIRLILAGDIEGVLKSDDLWRCTGCGACTEVCRMDIDVASVLAALRRLERDYGNAISCPERDAADIAAQRLAVKPTMDMMRFGLAMLARGHAPRDKLAAGEMGLRLAQARLPRRREGLAVAAPAGSDRPAEAFVVATGRPADAAAPDAVPFYAGCVLAQDRALHDLTRQVAAGFGVRLQEQADADCCGHPSRGVSPSRCRSGETVTTACPACEVSLRKNGAKTISLWGALVDRARRSGRRMQAAGPAFVPYVGCLVDRDAALAALAEAAASAGTTMRVSYPSLHSGCCGAVGGTYRGATKASAMLLDFAAGQQAPVVTSCALCRDNLRSAARELGHNVPVRFWPEFFRAGSGGRKGSTDE